MTLAPSTPLTTSHVKFPRSEPGKHEYAPGWPSSLEIFALTHWNLLPRLYLFWRALLHNGDDGGDGWGIAMMQDPAEGMERTVGEAHYLTTRRLLLALAISAATMVVHQASRKLRHEVTVASPCCWPLGETSVWPGRDCAAAPSTALSGDHGPRSSGAVRFVTNNQLPCLVFSWLTSCSFFLFCCCCCCWNVKLWTD